jgi:hypothetical protein
MGQCPRPRTAAPPAPIVRVGPGTYLAPGEAFAVVVSEAEDCVLQSFFRRPAMTLRELVSVSGVSDPAKVLARLVGRYGGSFAPAIRRPGRKGRGGYCVLVVDQHLSSIRPVPPAAPAEQSQHGRHSDH